MEEKAGLQDLKIEGKLFTGVSSFKYLRNVNNNGNRNNNCIKERIQTALRKGYKLKTRLTLQILANLKTK
jgi:hypothetical protein